ncbi:MAG: PQQ-binding-like beta-propeller repeat protein [Acidobacteria bacterium]|nr:PQQ-binding-like beta-propeller repeat protein [Acidobacteriota bacterium]
MNRPSSIAICLVSGLALALLAGCGSRPAAQESDLFASGVWPQWRGPQGAGISPLSDLPVHWAPDSDNLKWKIELTARGASQPIVSGGRIYLTGSHGGEGRIERTVTAVDVNDGSLLWETLISNRRNERKHHRFGSYSTPTPVTDGEIVWAYFGGYLAAVSRDGELLWRTKVDPDYWKTSRYGAASSPVLAGRAVIVYSDEEWGQERKGSRPSWLGAYDRHTGEELWRTEWRDTCCSYSTPLLRESEGGLELILSSTPWLFGVDVATGERLWQLELPVKQVVPSLVMADDILIQAGSVHKKRIIAYRLSGFGAGTKGEKIWKEVRAAPELASPVVYNGLLFAVTQGGVMSCFEPQTGELVWRERLPKTGYRSSIVAGDGKLYLMTLGSVTAVVAAEREFRLLAINDLEEYTESSIAVADECLLIRTKDHLYCIERGSGVATT